MTQGRILVLLNENILGQKSLERRCAKSTCREGSRKRTIQHRKLSQRQKNSLAAYIMTSSGLRLKLFDEKSVSKTELYICLKSEFSQ